MEDKVNKILNELYKEQAALNVLRKKNRALQNAAAGNVGFLTVSRESNKRKRELIEEFEVKEEMLEEILSLLMKKNIEEGLKQKEKVNLLVEDLKKC